MIKNCFPDAKQINQCPKSTLCKECKYVQEEKYLSEGNIDSPPDNGPTFSSEYSLEKPTVNVETIEERFKEMNLHRVQQKGDKGLYQEYENIEQFNTKRGMQHSPRSHLQI